MNINFSNLAGHLLKEIEREGCHINDISKIPTIVNGIEDNKEWRVLTLQYLAETKREIQRLHLTLLYIADRLPKADIA